MSYFEVFLIGVGLSMDAFAVSVCKGLAMKKVLLKQALLISLFFGGFQAIMPLLGYFLGDRFYKYIFTFGPWISFGLLAYIGGKLFWDGIKERGEVPCADECTDLVSIRDLTMLAVATSIDAFAVGVTFSLMQVNIISSIIIIGITTFVICLFAVYLGNIAGAKWSTPAKITGGLILVFLGVKILVESFI